MMFDIFCVTLHESEQGWERVNGLGEQEGVEVCNLTVQLGRNSRDMY